MSLTVSFQQARQENGAVDDPLEANKVLTFTLHTEDFGKLSCAARASRHAVSSQAQVQVFRRKETTPPLHIRGIPKKKTFGLLAMKRPTCNQYRHIHQLSCGINKIVAVFRD